MSSMTLAAGVLLLTIAQGFRISRAKSKSNLTSQSPCPLICKCVGGGDESSASCQKDTCAFSPLPGLPFWCLKPRCKTIDDWGDCEWANWNEEENTEELPGTGVYSDLPEWKVPRSSKGFGVLSDVDDTMKCSGGPPGGADRECIGTEKHEMYPGVGEFALALARGALDGMNPRKVAPLSARPNELKWFLEMKPNSTEDKTYRRAAEAVGIQGWGLDTENAQYGSIFDLTDHLGLPGLTRFGKLGYRKFSNWQKMGGKWGGAVAFIGDNGQGDHVAAQMMLKRSEGLTDEQGALRVAFIHDVLRKCKSSKCRDAWAKLGIQMFEHYPHAAGLAAKQGLISQSSCRAVCAAAPTLSCSCP